MINSNTHKQYTTYAPEDLDNLIKFMDSFRYLIRAKGAMYKESIYLIHLEENLKVVKECNGKVPANIIFWVYRTCSFMRVTAPVYLPHIVKKFEDGVERFFVVTRDEWFAHRELTNSGNTTPKVHFSDHAKLNYLARVLKIPIKELLKDMPSESLLDKPRVSLPMGKDAIRHGAYTYIMQGNQCITILEEGMQYEQSN